MFSRKFVVILLAKLIKILFIRKFLCAYFTLSISTPHA